MWKRAYRQWQAWFVVGVVGLTAVASIAMVNEAATPEACQPDHDNHIAMLCVYQDGRNGTDVEIDDRQRQKAGREYILQGCTEEAVWVYDVPYATAHEYICR